jgi:DNA-directed RNA polymerase specialized sigma24 family protein
MKKISTKERHLILREIYRHYLDYKDHYARTGHDILVGGTHDDDCQWWDRLKRVNKKIDPSIRDKDAPCTCGFSETGPVMISFLELQNSLKNLSKRKKEAVFLNVILDLTQREVAEVMQIKMVTVGQYVKSAMQKIEKEYFADDPNYTPSTIELDDLDT